MPASLDPITIYRTPGSASLSLTFSYLSRAPTEDHDDPRKGPGLKGHHHPKCNCPKGKPALSASQADWQSVPYLLRSSGRCNLCFLEPYHLLLAPSDCAELLTDTIRRL